LDAHQIGCGMHYPLPLHLQKAFAYLGYKPGDFPIAEKAAQECLSLPIYPELTEQEIGTVTDTIADFFSSKPA
jgi:dTDP-4-amino-4,6-dideoxygalactose transaminase